MMNNWMYRAFVAATFLVGGSLTAQDDLSLNYRSGLYLAGTVGQTFQYEITGNELVGTSDETSYDLEDGTAYTGALGVYVGQARVELELGFRDADFESFDPQFLGFDLAGDLEYFTIMGNLFYDVPTDVPNLDLYLGGGLGVAIVSGDADFTPPITVAVIGGPGSATTGRFDDTSQTFAYQFMGGLSYRIADNITVTGGYRFRRFSEFNDDRSLLTFREHTVHAAEIGLRIDF